jgi:hypothetical protein
MRYFFGCLLAAAAGAGFVFVPHSEFYENPEWVLPWAFTP